ncbi:hypothetical protein SRU_1376 [Salinibacter ruber DSM 13855]|uniref:Uncharacterized protein n=2 Tax=Salinibacter ruber TaxID=146919 RepID=Q2S2T1_SALRD|nr:hypothetical protein SRU_1376 [Salinibacter ruber DSM 13855]CBH24492.1 conserved hypothetical protein [Salinibacter ruber M8]
MFLDGRAEGDEILGAFRITNSAGAFGWVHTHVLC